MHQNGIQYEQFLRNIHKDNPLYDFLRPSSPYYHYYLTQLAETLRPVAQVDHSGWADNKRTKVYLLEEMSVGTMANIVKEAVRKVGWALPFRECSHTRHWHHKTSLHSAKFRPAGTTDKSSRTCSNLWSNKGIPRRNKKSQKRRLGNFRRKGKWSNRVRNLGRRWICRAEC